MRGFQIIIESRKFAINAKVPFNAYSFRRIDSPEKRFVPLLERLLQIRLREAGIIIQKQESYGIQLTQQPEVSLLLQFLSFPLPERIFILTWQKLFF